MKKEYRLSKSALADIKATLRATKAYRFWMCVELLFYTLVNYFATMYILLGPLDTIPFETKVSVYKTAIQLAFKTAILFHL
jgi:hypothetical protein